MQYPNTHTRRPTPRTAMNRAVRTGQRGGPVPGPLLLILVHQTATAARWINPPPSGLVATGGRSMHLATPQWSRHMSMHPKPAGRSIITRAERQRRCAVLNQLLMTGVTHLSARGLAYGISPVVLCWLLQPPNLTPSSNRVSSQHRCLRLHRIARSVLPSNLMGAMIPPYTPVWSCWAVLNQPVLPMLQQKHRLHITPPHRVM